MRLSDEAAYASNWRTVLLVDAGVAAVAFVSGAILIAIGHPLGFIAVLVGLGYGAMIASRARRWRRLRRARYSSDSSGTTMSQRSRHSSQR
jgi:hypothetical protein